MKRAAAVALLVLAALPAAAQEYIERILLPLAFRSDLRIAGSRGTVWRGEVWVENRSSSSVFLENTLQCVTGGPCLPLVTQQTITLLDDLLTTRTEPGIVLSPRTDDLPQLTFSNRLFEISRHAQPQGIELPVVHERDFKTGTTSLLAIPSGSAVRTALRVYDPDASGISVRADFVASDGTVLATRTLVTSLVPHETLIDYIRPGFATIYDLAAEIPQLAAVDRYHIRMTLLSGRRFWAMASVTDNDTEQVLIVTPQ